MTDTNTNASLNPFWMEEDLQAMIARDTNKLPEKYSKLETTSARIRAMVADGYKPMQVAKLLGKRPQHVYNVLKQPLKRK